MSNLSALIEQYLAGAAELRAAVQGMSRQQLLARPIEGKMSTLEVVCRQGRNVAATEVVSDDLPFHTRKRGTMTCPVVSLLARWQAFDNGGLSSHFLTNRERRR